MGSFIGPDIVEDGLTYAIDAGSARSYSGSGTAINNLAGTPDATFQNAPTFSSANGGVWDFDGVDEWANLGTVDLTVGFTLETFCYPHYYPFSVWGQGPTASNKGLHLISNTTGGRGMVYGFYANDNDYGNYIPAINNWYHWVFTYNGTSFAKAFYANGVLQTPTSAVQNAYTETASGLRLAIAFGPNVSSTPANGAFGCARVYNRPLSLTEVNQNFNAQRSRFGL